jgi:hypothetical protein
VGRDGVPTTEGHLVMLVPDKIAMENVNSPGRVVADKYHRWTRIKTGDGAFPDRGVGKGDMQSTLVSWKDL